LLWKSDCRAWPHGWQQREKVPTSRCEKEV
jgi:hypothetical protein